MKNFKEKPKFLRFIGGGGDPKIITHRDYSCFTDL